MQFGVTLRSLENNTLSEEEPEDTEEESEIAVCRRQDCDREEEISLESMFRVYKCPMDHTLQLPAPSPRLSLWK